MFSELRRKVIVRFVDISGIDNHHYLHCFFIIFGNAVFMILELLVDSLGSMRVTLYVLDLGK